MGRSAFISAALHVAIVLWLVVVIDGSPLDGDPIREIPVEILTPSELTQIKAGSQDAKSEAPLAPKPKEEKPVAVNEKKAEQEATPPPPPPEEAPPVEETPPEEQVQEDVPPLPPDPPEPDPEPEPETAEAPPPPDESPDPAEVAENRPTPSAPLRKPPPPPQPKQQAETPSRSNRPAPETQSDSSTDRLAALLNKMPDGGEEPTLDEPPQEQAEEEVHGQTDGTELTMSVNEIDALRSRIAQCWNLPPGGLGAERIIVKLRMQLNEDGTLVGYPTVENSGNSPFFRAAADSAVRAVYQCQPYPLPIEKYSLWRDMILNFDPSDMYRAG
ncbi:hypothetical protein A7A08_01603 [Methyloligella halotolerans]|uniref:Uncharacterized protein n=1 Tax=Methyloligella halotolerans TaxID=1177755 RepID=A0A1E2RZT9_9HYPH|nr:cell envelope integrity protein TolA [Methyloligella halotolerans]ODA67569.1 hypothetical protein A7A08_01603 [Methyloligella halotolerans]